jgi:hypothetical protein
MPRSLTKMLTAERGVVAGEDVGDAVLEHPGRAGGGGDDVVEGLGVGAGADAQRHGLGGGGDMDAGEELVDHLRRAAGPDLGAEAPDLAGDGAEHGGGLGEAGLGAGGHDGHAAAVGGDLAAGDGGVEHDEAAFGEAGGQVPGGLGATVTQQRTGCRREAVDAAVGAEEDVVRLGRVDDRR